LNIRSLFSANSSDIKEKAANHITAENHRMEDPEKKIFDSDFVLNR
jgi:hypothetical protein